MALALSALLNQALPPVGFLPLPSVYVASTDPAVLQYVGLASRVAVEQRRFAWNYIHKQGSQALTTGTQAYDLPADFWGLIPDTLIKNSSYNYANMPATPIEWAQFRSTGARGAVYNARIYQNKLQVQSAVTGDTLNYEYLSSYPITTADGVTSKLFFTVDTDLWKFDDGLFILDFTWRLKKEKGFDDWQVDFAAYQNYAKTLQGYEAGSQTLFMAGLPDNPPISEPYTNLWVQ